MAKKRKLPPLQHKEEEEEKNDDVEEAGAEEEEEEDEEEEEAEEDTSASSSSSEEGEEEEEDESSKREELRKLLEPFNKDQLIDIIKEAALNDPSLYDQVVRVADSDPAHRKIFVHGLSSDTTSEELLRAFQPFGEIEECKLITDKATGRAKGYAFVLLKTRAAAKKALLEPVKRIGNRNVPCQLASVGPAAPGGAPDVSDRKIYVANVGPNVDAEKLRAFFGKFGEVEEGPLGFDSATRKSKGFVIFLYKSAQGCKNALEEPAKMFDGCKLYCKKFIENINNNNNGANKNQLGDDNYGVGVTQGPIGSNMDMGALLMAQNQLGFAGNPMMASVMNQAGYAVPGLSMNYGINALAPGIAGVYGSQGVYPGLGVYQNAQMAQSPASRTVSQSGSAPAGTTFASYFGR